MGNTNLLAFGKDIVGGGNIGHKILNRIKIALTQRPALWFKDTHVTDDAGNSSTDVEIIKDVTSAQFTALATDGSTEGAYNITDEDVIPTDAEYIGYDHTDSGMSANNVQDAIDELNADITTVEVETLVKNGDTIRFDLKNGVCSFYGSLAHLSSSDTVVAFGILPAKFKPRSVYAIFNPFSQKSPYSSLANTSLWIDNNSGNVVIYKAAEITRCYVYGEYMVIL